MNPFQRMFLYLPFEHSEDRNMQNESIRLDTDLGGAQWLAFAENAPPACSTIWEIPGQECRASGAPSTIGGNRIHGSLRGAVLNQAVWRAEAARSRSLQPITRSGAAIGIASCPLSRRPSKRTWCFSTALAMGIAQPDARCHPSERRSRAGIDKTLETVPDVAAGRD